MKYGMRIVILTGAGVSAESGLDTFRDTGGLWSQVNIEEVATPQGFAANPDKVHDFYNARRAGMAGVKPNSAHHALAELERRHGGDFLLVTQNIDNLHEAAGSRKLIHMHGEIMQRLCVHCGQRTGWPDEMNRRSICPQCDAPGGMRPDVVWFGEIPYRMDEIYESLSRCDLFVAIGTSGTVYPAAGFVAEARACGARTLELNLEPSDGTELFDEARHGPATRIVPQWVDEVLAG